MQALVGFVLGIVLPAILSYGVYVDLNSVSLAFSVFYMIFLSGLSMSYAYKAKTDIEKLEK